MGKKIEKPDVAPMKAAAAKAVTPAKAAAKTPAASKSPTPKSAGKAKKSPTHAEIQTQAYFVAERRRKLHLPGDQASDWIEAERQLLAGE